MMQFTNRSGLRRFIHMPIEALNQMTQGGLTPQPLVDRSINEIAQGQILCQHLPCLSFPPRQAKGGTVGLILIALDLAGGALVTGLG